MSEDNAGPPEQPAPDSGVPEPPEPPTPLQRALDLVLFAPVGMALTAVEDLPALVARGRQEVTNARIVGKFVVDQGQREVTRRLGDLFGRGGEAAEPAVAAPSQDAPPPASTASASAEEEAVRPTSDPADVALVEAALEGYDTLSASQVVRRLENLGPDELRAVHRHEASHRNRRTILNRTTQLLDTSGGSRAADSNGNTGGGPTAAD